MSWNDIRIPSRTLCTFDDCRREAVVDMTIKIPNDWREMSTCRAHRHQVIIALLRVLDEEYVS